MAEELNETPKIPTTAKEVLDLNAVRQMQWDIHIKKVFWNEKQDKYYYRHEIGAEHEWHAYSLANLRIHLDRSGLFSHIVDSDPKVVTRRRAGYLQEFQAYVLRNNAVKGCGAIGGRTEGVHKAVGEKFLVTSNPELIEPIQGNFEFIQEFLTLLLPGPQVHHFLQWLKLAYLSVKTQRKKNGQALFFIGPAGCGKSLLQHRVISPILGGREGNPFMFMCGGNFNSDLTRSDHLVIEDAAPTGRGFNRNTFASKIKEFTVNQFLRSEAKNQDAVMVEPIQRMTMSLNEESYNFELIPALDDSLADKIMIFRCKPATDAYPSEDLEPRISECLPAFLWWLLNVYQAPEGILTKDRMGVRSYHDPVYRARVEEHGPEAYLLSFFQVYFTSTNLPELKGYATQIYTILQGHPDIGRGVSNQFKTVKYFGRVLNALCRRNARVFQALPRTKAGSAYCVINDPELFACA